MSDREVEPLNETLRKIGFSADDLVEEEDEDRSSRRKSRRDEDKDIGIEKGELGRLDRINQLKSEMEDEKDDEDAVINTADAEEPLLQSLTDYKSKKLDRYFEQVQHIFEQSDMNETDLEEVFRNIRRISREMAGVTSDRYKEEFEEIREAAKRALFKVQDGDLGKQKAVDIAEELKDIICDSVSEVLSK